MAKDQAIDLSGLPIPVPPGIQGTPLPHEDLVALPPTEHQALKALFDHAKALLFEGAPLTEQSYKELAQQYAAVKELGLTHYCSVKKIRDSFRLD